MLGAQAAPERSFYDFRLEDHVPTDHLVQRELRGTTIERTMDRFGLYHASLVGDTAYGTADMLGWLVYKHSIEPHIPVFDKSMRTDGTFSPEGFHYDVDEDSYVWPSGKNLRQYRRPRRQTKAKRRKRRVPLGRHRIELEKARQTQTETAAMQPTSLKTIRPLAAGGRVIARPH